VPYYALPDKILAGDEVIALLKAIRQHCDAVVITGGEPLQHPDVQHVLEQVGRLRFRHIVLTTNGYDLDRYLDRLPGAVHSLVFSLDTLQDEKADAWYGIGPGVLAKILSNIARAASYPGRNYDIVISGVVTPKNIADLYAVYQYARERGFLFAVAPQLIGVKAHPALENNLAYQKFYTFLIAEKKRGARIFGTLRYLTYLQNLQKFSCHPFTMLVISPTGDVFYPCLEIGHFAGNLLREKDLHQIRQAGYARFGPQPKCDTRCHSACALGFALALDYPWSLIYEGYLTAKGRVNV
jgi:molybdenum cofactor biosynthesis enzyme MoaA